MLRLNDREFAVRLVEGRGTHTAWSKSEGDLPCAICVGVPLQVNLAAAMSPPPGVDELGIAHALSPTPLVRCKSNDLYVPADAELVLEGKITKRFIDEGPFPDLTETMDIVRQGQIIQIDLITHRRQPIYHALLPGGLEHKLLMGMPREPTIFAEVNKVAHCVDVRITPGGASWLHAVVQIEKQRSDDGKLAIQAAFRGHGSLKHVVIIDSDIDISSPTEIEWAIATRFQADRDLVVFPDQPGSSLDPSGIQVPGSKARTSKMGLDATIPWDKNRADFEKIRYQHVQLDRYLS
jgi:UbiD family decarboxylase